jgi:Holliday junction resolvase RusA-like endonuclease
MKAIAFFVAGTPKGQPRPRAFVRQGRARVYDPGTAEGWKGQVALAARGHLPSVPIAAPVLLHLRFHLPRPRGHFGQGGLRASAPAHHVARPDVDNLAKAVLDALVGIGLLQDDRWVRLLLVTKQYANTTPGCAVRLAW